MLGTNFIMVRIVPNYAVPFCSKAFFIYFFVDGSSSASFFKKANLQTGSEDSHDDKSSGINQMHATTLMPG